MGGKRTLAPNAAQQSLRMEGLAIGRVSFRDRQQVTCNLKGAPLVCPQIVRDVPSCDVRRPAWTCRVVSIGPEVGAIPRWDACVRVGVAAVSADRRWISHEADGNVTVCREHEQPDGRIAKSVYGRPADRSVDILLKLPRPHQRVVSGKARRQRGSRFRAVQVRPVIKGPAGFGANSSGGTLAPREPAATVRYSAAPAGL